MRVATISLFLVILNYSNAVEFNCQYKIEQKSLIGDVYGCDMKNIKGNLSDDSIFTSSGNHIENFTNFDVKFIDFSFINSQISSIPKKVYLIFPNLIALSCDGCSINSLDSDDLKNYENLQYLKITNSNFTKIPSNFFTPASKIVFINFNNNKITSVRQSVFESLENLQEIFMLNNTCISGSGTEIADIRILISIINFLCPDDEAQNISTTEYTTKVFNFTTEKIDETSTKILSTLKTTSTVTQRTSKMTTKSTETKSDCRKILIENGITGKFGVWLTIKNFHKNLFELSKAVWNLTMNSC